MEPILNRLYGLLFTAVLLATPASGTAPAFTGTSATICNVANCVMIPGYTVSDSDGDTFTYVINRAAVTGLTIDSDTGLVTTSVVLSDDAYTLVVTDSNAESVTQAITFSVFPDANPPTIGGTFTASVAENVVAGTTVPTSYTADGGDTGDGVTYEISGTDAAFFKIGLFDGVLTTAATLDYETKSSFSVELTVKDSKRTPSSPQALTITVTDIPACNPNTIDTKMTKGATAGTVVTTLSCSTTGTALVYAITAGNTNTDFGISTAAGVITVINQLATVAVYDIKVTVTSGAETPIVDVKVSVIDVTTLSCTDPDSQTLTYTFLDGNKDDDFALDSSTGKITVDKALDNSRTSSYVVKAAVVDTVMLTATTTTTINVQAASGAINIANHMYIVAGLILLMKYNFE